MELRYLIKKDEQDSKVILGEDSVQLFHGFN